MSLQIISEVWNILKPTIETSELNGAAEALVSYLVEEDDFSPADLKQVFRGDLEITKAINYFLDSPEDGLYADVSEEEEDEDEEYDE